MGTENIDQIVTREAGENVTNMRFIVEQASDSTVDRASVAGEAVDGVVAMVSYGGKGSTIAEGDAVPVALRGDVLMEAGAAIDAGAEVMTDNVGRAIPFVADDAASAAGRLTNKTSASAAGDIVTVRMYEKGQYVGVAVS